MPVVQPTPAPSRERTLFLAALGLPPARRPEFLERECEGSPGLRAVVDDLLAEHAILGGFLESPAHASGDPPETRVPRERPGDRLGPYRLHEVIGEGGCGIVYHAEQEEPVRRRVALKIIKLGMDTRGVIARFEAERQALALMEHPHIARVLDAGATETGRPFFVMELVRGIRITEYCDTHQLPVVERLRLFLDVCRAVQHAHQKGIIHRDLKPSNILVTVNDGVAVPKVIDFGIAKATEQRLTDKTILTAFHAFVGTPAYMSPEQAGMSSVDVDTRSDIFSLGVLLYELLTGQTPLDADTLARAEFDEVRRMLRETDPARPSHRVASLPADQLSRTAERQRVQGRDLILRLRGDLDWIVMKCLEKDRTRRYETASALALDIERFLANEPISARPPSTLYRFAKFHRRHRLVMTASAAALLALVAASVISTQQALRALRAERAEAGLRHQADLDSARARRGEAVARLNEYVAEINLAQQSLAAGNYGRAIQLVEKHRPSPAHPDLRGFEWRYLWEQCRGHEHRALPNQGGSIHAVALSPDERFLAVGLRGLVRILDPRDGREITRLPGGAFSLAFPPDGASLVVGGHSEVHVWRTADWTESASFPGEAGPAALAPQGDRLAAPTRTGLVVRGPGDWTVFRHLAGHSGPLAFSPDGLRLACGFQTQLRILRLDAEDPPVVLENSGGLAAGRPGPFRMDRGLAFSADGRSVMAARNRHSERGTFVVSVWNAETGRETATLPDDPNRPFHTGNIASLALSPDGRLLATGGWDHAIQLWDVGLRRNRGSLQGQPNEVWSVAWFPDGSRLASGAKDGSLFVWPAYARSGERSLAGDWLPLGFTAPGPSLVVTRPDGTVAVINLTSAEIERSFPAPRSGRPGSPFGSPVAFSPAAGLVARLRSDAEVELLDLATGESRSFRAAERRLENVFLSPDGRTLVTTAADEPVQSWSVADPPARLRTLQPRFAGFLPDGLGYVARPHRGPVEIWNLADDSRRTAMDLEPGEGFQFLLSADGRWVATATGPEESENLVRLRDAGTGRIARVLAGHKQPVMALAFSPDGRTLATSGADSTVKLWNLASGQELLAFRRPGLTYYRILFSPDGHWLALGGGPEAGLRWLHAPSLAETDTQPDASSAP